MSNAAVVKAPIRQSKCTLSKCYKIQRDVPNLPINEAAWKELCDEIDAALYVSPHSLVSTNLTFLAVCIGGFALMIVSAAVDTVASNFLYIGLAIILSMTFAQIVILQRMEVPMRTAMTSICNAWSSRQQSQGVKARLKQEEKSSFGSVFAEFFVEVGTVASSGDP